MCTAQCLQSGDISKCLPYTVETLRFNATAELNRKDDNRRGLWIMTGVVVRAAINMSYHRDPGAVVVAARRTTRACRVPPPRVARRRDRCIASALAVLAYQQGLDLPLYQILYTRQLLALAAMVLLLELELRRKGPDAGAAPASALLLQALEKSCGLWETAAGVCDESWRVHQCLVGMLSGFGIGTSTTEIGSSHMVTPEDPSDLLGSSPHFDGGFSFEDGLYDVDFD
jgi:hypothetical protein